MLNCVLPCPNRYLMSSQPTIVDFIIDQMSEAGEITARKMFGDYGVYCDGVIVGLICDDQLFVKPTMAGLEYLGESIKKPPYPGAKPYIFIPSDLLENTDWLAGLIKLTKDELS